MILRGPRAVLASFSPRILTSSLRFLLSFVCACLPFETHIRGLSFGCDGSDALTAQTVRRRRKDSMLRYRCPLPRTGTALPDTFYSFCGHNSCLLNPEIRCVCGLARASRIDSISIPPFRNCRRTPLQKGLSKYTFQTSHVNFELGCSVQTGPRRSHVWCKDDPHPPPPRLQCWRPCPTGIIVDIIS